MYVQPGHAATTITSPSDAVVMATVELTSELMVPGGDASVVTVNSMNTSEGGKHMYELAQLATGLVCFPILCVLGLLGNALSIAVLSEKRMTSSTTSYLITMAASDSIKLLNDLVYFVVTLLFHLNQPLGQMAYAYIYPYAHYVFHASVAVTSLLVVCITVERYVIICRRPAGNSHAVHQQRCNAAHAKLISATIFVGVGLLLSPLAFRYRTTRVCNNATNETSLDVETTELWQQDAFKTAFVYFHNVAFLIGPLLTLCVLNVFIIRTLRRSRLRSRRLALHRRVTLMLVTVTLVFMVCITPDAIMSTVFGLGYTDASYVVRAVREVTDLLLTVNASVNFFLYCAFHHAFRDRLGHTVGSMMSRCVSPPPSPSMKPLTTFHTSIQHSQRSPHNHRITVVH